MDSKESGLWLLDEADKHARQLIGTLSRIMKLADKRKNGKLGDAVSDIAEAIIEQGNELDKLAREIERL